MEISQLGFAFVKPSPFAFVWRWQFQLQRQSNRAHGRGYFTAFIENKASLAQWEYWHWSECRSVVNNEYLLISVTAKINCFFPPFHFTHSVLELKNQCIKICTDFTHAHKIGINNCIDKGFIVPTSPLYVHQIASVCNREEIPHHDSTTDLHLRDSEKNCSISVRHVPASS